jgi:hypothetical protein
MADPGHRFPRMFMNAMRARRTHGNISCWRKRHDFACAPKQIGHFWRRLADTTETGVVYRFHLENTLAVRKEA